MKKRLVGLLMMLLVSASSHGDLKEMFDEQEKKSNLTVPELNARIFSEIQQVNQSLWKDNELLFVVTKNTIKGTKDPVGIYRWRGDIVFVPLFVVGGSVVTIVLRDVCDKNNPFYWKKQRIDCGEKSRHTMAVPFAVGELDFEDWVSFEAGPRYDSSLPKGWLSHFSFSKGSRPDSFQINVRTDECFTKPSSIGGFETEVRKCQIMRKKDFHPNLIYQTGGWKFLKDAVDWKYYHP